MAVKQRTRQRRCEECGQWLGKSEAGIVDRTWYPDKYSVRKEYYHRDCFSRMPAPLKPSAPVMEKRSEAYRTLVWISALVILLFAAAGYTIAFEKSVQGQTRDALLGFVFANCCLGISLYVILQLVREK